MKRSNYDIIADILRVCRSPTGINIIMSDANISFSQTKKLFPLLLERGFLSSLNGRPQLYSTTEKGMVLLLAIENVQIMLGYKSVIELVCRESNSKPYT